MYGLMSVWGYGITFDNRGRKVYMPWNFFTSANNHDKSCPEIIISFALACIPDPRLIESGLALKPFRGETEFIFQGVLGGKLLQDSRDSTVASRQDESIEMLRPLLTLHSCNSPLGLHYIHHERCAVSLMRTIALTPTLILCREFSNCIILCVCLLLHFVKLVS